VGGLGAPNPLQELSLGLQFGVGAGVGRIGRGGIGLDTFQDRSNRQECDEWLGESWKPGKSIVVGLGVR
jgi:hypothetical protein